MEEGGEIVEEGGNIVEEGGETVEEGGEVVDEGGEIVDRYYSGWKFKGEKRSRSIKRSGVMEISGSE